MALTSSGIEQAREFYKKIVEDVAGLSELLEIKNFMDSDKDFSNFVSGTAFGKENYDKWQNLVSLISNDLEKAMVSLEEATNKFLEQQQNFNNSNHFSGGTSMFPGNSGNESSFNILDSYTAPTLPGTSNPPSASGSAGDKSFSGAMGSNVVNFFNNGSNKTGDFPRYSGDYWLPGFVPGSSNTNYKS